MLSKCLTNKIELETKWPSSMGSTNPTCSAIFLVLPSNENRSASEVPWLERGRNTDRDQLNTCALLISLCRSGSWQTLQPLNKILRDEDVYPTFNTRMTVGPERTDKTHRTYHL